MNESIRHIDDLRYAYGETMPKPDVGRRPERECEAMLSLPIGYRDFFGKNKLLVSRVTLGDLEYELVGVRYYYDNNLSPSVHLTDEGFAYASAAHYVLDMNVQLIGNLQSDKHYTSLSAGYYDYTPCFGMEQPIYVQQIYSFLAEGTPFMAKLALTVSEYNDGSGGAILAEHAYTEADLAEHPGASRFLTGQGAAILDAALLLDLSRKVAPLTYSQASFFFESDARAESAAAELRALGYVAVPSYATYTPDPFETVTRLIGAVMQAILWLSGTLFVAFFLSVAVTRAMRAFGGDVAILRSMGIRSEVVRSAVYVRMLLSMLPGAAAVAIVAFLVFRSPTLNGYFVYLYARHYLAIALGTLILTLFVTHRSTRRLFGKSVRSTLRGGGAK
jgi:hypothetical protein